MRLTTTVLSLGLEEWRNAVCEVLIQNEKNSILGVNNCWDLCALSQAVTVDIAVLHYSFALHGLRYAAEYILVIGEQAEQLDDPLYDDKASSAISLDELAQMIETLVAAKRRIRRSVRSGLVDARGQAKEAGGTTTICSA